MPQVLFQYQEPNDRFRKVFRSIILSKIFNFLSLLFLVLAIPVTVLLAQQQQEIRQHAAEPTPTKKTARLSIEPVNSSVAVGHIKSFDIMIDPVSHSVSFVKITLHHTNPHLEPTTISPCRQTVCLNTERFASLLEGPSYAPGFITFSAIIGPEPKNAIRTPTKIATVYFKVKQTTEPNKATLDFLTLNDSTQILSISEEDAPTANVLGEALSAEMIITK